MRTTTLIAALTLATRAAAHAQGAHPDPRLARLDPAARPAVIALVDSVREAGLPAEPLIQRALEGAAKGAPADRIVTAVRRLAADVGRARDALGPATTAPELEAGAAALRAGASPATLSGLRRARRAPLTVPLAVLADLVASGVPADSAAAAVLALAGTARDADLVEFRRAVERDIALGAPPAAAAAVRVGASGLTTGTAADPQSRPPRP